MLNHFRHALRHYEHATRLGKGLGCIRAMLYIVRLGISIRKYSPERKLGGWQLTHSLLFCPPHPRRINEQA